jgi:putative lipoprotein
MTSGPKSTISFGGIGATAMACLDEGVMDQEQRFLDALSRIDRFTLGGGTLVLEATDGSAVIRLVPEQTEPDLPLAGSWRLVTLIDGDIASSVISGTQVTLEIDLDAMTVNGNGGCNGYGGPIEVEGDTTAPLIPITIGPLISTMMACEEGIMDQEAAVLGILGDAATASVDGSLLTISTADRRALVFESAGE